jgi:hypothetical protein
LRESEILLAIKTENALHLFYDDIMDKKDLRHFFFGMDFKNMVRDYHLYKHYVMVKSARYYTDMVMQTSPSNIQVKAPQFEEILFSLRTKMRTATFLKADIPKLSVHILEVIEEIRAQKSDSEVNLLISREITNQLICDFYNRNRMDARLEKNGDVYVSRGFLYPFWTRVALDRKQIIFIGQAFSVSSFTPLGEFVSLCEQINKKVTQQEFFLREGPRGTVLYARHAFSYLNGLPVRMLLRGAKQFAASFEEAVYMDNNKLLIKQVG